ncbi:MAG TPA: ParA family protein [Caulobacteraceae bacterium]
MRTIAVVARKGGSGKTTVAVHLALAAHLAGKRTALADLDPQASATEVLKARYDSGPRHFVSPARGLPGAQVTVQRAGMEALFIDTPAGTEAGMSNAIVVSDLTVMVVRPTFLDLVAAARTAEVLKWMRKPGVVILNQAPPARGGIEPPSVRKALKVLAVLGLPIVPIVLRARASYQTSLERGASVLETEPTSAAAEELGALWRFMEKLAFAQRPRLESRAG